MRQETLQEQKKTPLTRGERRAEKKRLKKAEKNDKNFEGEAGFTNTFGYNETDPYIFLKKNVVMSMFDINFKYGTNSPAKIGWVTETLIPKDNISEGKIWFVQRQALVPKGTEGTIKDKNIESQVLTIQGNKANSATESSKNEGRLFDLGLAQGLAGQEDKIVDTDVILVIKASSPEAIEQIVKELKTSYRDKQVKGVMFTRMIGEQLKTLSQLFVKTSADNWHNTDMGAVAAGRMFLPSSGFSDARGNFVGIDKLSLLANNPSLIDFSQIKNAVVYMGDVAPVVSVGGLEDSVYMLNGGSAIATQISKGNYFSGQRTHHINLSKASYHLPDSLIFDMSKEAINPLEVFGTPETVAKDANANFAKATRMMLYASGTENNVYISERLEKNLIEWMTYNAGGNGMYAEDPLEDPNAALKILATTDHETYPTPKQFFLNLVNDKAKAASEDTQTYRDANHMSATMNKLATQYPTIFASTTTLPDVFKASDRNIYYELGEVSEDKTIKGIQFLNVLAYVTNRALPGEQIVIHGIDQMSLPVEAFVDYKERITSKNINLITVFEHMDNPVNPVSFEKFSGRLSQQDMVVLGGVSHEELDKFGESWQKHIPGNVANELAAANEGTLYFYRSLDNVGALIDTHIVL